MNKYDDDALLQEVKDIECRIWRAIVLGIATAYGMTAGAFMVLIR